MIPLLYGNNSSKVVIKQLKDLGGWPGLEFKLFETLDYDTIAGAVEALKDNIESYIAWDICHVPLEVFRKEAVVCSEYLSECVLVWRQKPKFNTFYGFVKGKEDRYRGYCRLAVLTPTLDQHVFNNTPTYSELTIRHPDALKELARSAKRSLEVKIESCLNNAFSCPTNEGVFPTQLCRTCSVGVGHEVVALGKLGNCVECGAWGYIY